MPEKMPIYRIDENLLRSKLLGYNVEMNTGTCDAIEQEVSSLRFKKSINLPKVNLKVVVPALLLIGIVTVVYFNFDSIKGMFEPAPEVKMPELKVSQPAVQKPVVTTPTVAANPVQTQTAAVLPLPNPMQNVVANKVDSSAIKKTDTSKQEAAKKVATPVMAPPPSDSAAKKAEVNKADTSVQKSDQPVKKKRKRRRRNANMDELKQSTLESSGSDDDVVVPQ